MSTPTSGATIFYTLGTVGYPADPTHNGSTATNGTMTYSGSPMGINNGQHRWFKALAYKDGMIDSAVNSYEVDNSAPPQMPNPGDGGPGGGGVTVGNEQTIVYDLNGNLTQYKDWTYSYDAQ